MDPSLELPTQQISALLKEHGLHPRKGLGQNFLVDPGSLRKVIDAADIPAHAAVLEVGAGLGSLTRALAQAARRVVAVELDADLLPPLRQVLEPFANVTIVQGDILALDPVELLDGQDYLVVANIPYYITSALIRHLLEARIKPARLVLTVQREVAQRICAGPGEMSLLALSVQVYGRAEIVARIPAEAFYPPPKVDSAVVRVNLYAEPLIPAERLELFFRLARAGFSQKRKTLRNSLSAGLGITPAEAAAKLQAAGIDPQRRAETLALEEWRGLVEHSWGKILDHAEAG